MGKYRKIICSIILATLLSGNLIAVPYLSENHKIEAAVKEPGLVEHSKTLYLGYKEYKIKLENLFKGAVASYRIKDPKIASVSAGGSVTAKAEGTTNVIITVKQNARTYQLSFEVIVKKPYISFMKSTDYLNASETYQFTAKEMGMEKPVTWSVSDTTIASISATGKMKALKAGYVTVTAKAGDKSVKCSVTIGTNRLSTASKNLTISADKTIWVKMKDIKSGEKLTCTAGNSKVIKTIVYEPVGNVVKININVTGTGMDKLTIKSDKTTDRLVVNVNVVKREELKTLSAAEIYDKCNPSIVELHVEKKYSASQGSGFFIDTNTVVTNYHVIKGAMKIQVTTKDNKMHDVNTIIGYNEQLDLAIIKVEADNLPLDLAQTKGRTGEDVYALGSPLGMTGTITKGIITSANRDVAGINCIQMDAPISVGNSGGPLVNAYGEVIGVNTMYYPEGQNMNLAVDISELKKVTIDNPISVTDYYASFEKAFKDSMITEDTSKTNATYSNDTQEAPSSIGVKGSLTQGSENDHYRFTVWEPEWIDVIVTTENSTDLENLSLSLQLQYAGQIFSNNEGSYLRVSFYLTPGVYVLNVAPKNTLQTEIPYSFFIEY